MEYSPVLISNEVTSCAKTWMNFKCIFSSERNNIKMLQTICFYFYDIPGKTKL